MKSRRIPHIAASLIGALALGSLAGTAVAQTPFKANGGPTIKDALKNLSAYTIDVEFTLDSTDGYQKIIDFKGKTVDPGIYDADGELMFYGQASTDDAVIKPGEAAHLHLTRDATTGIVTARVDNGQTIQFKDDAGDAVFATNSIPFFQDDSHTDGRESGSGKLTSISVDGTQVYPAPPKAPAGTPAPAPTTPAAPAPPAPTPAPAAA